MKLALIIPTALFALLSVNACKSVHLQENKLKDAVFQIENRFILLTGASGNQIKVKECANENPPPEPNTFDPAFTPEKDSTKQFESIKSTRDCERRPGTIERTFMVDDFIELLLSNSGLRDFPNNSSMYESLDFLRKYNVDTSKFREEYKKSVLEAEEKLKAFREMVLAFDDDPYIPSSEKFQKSLEEIKRMPENARGALIGRLQTEGFVLLDAMRTVFQKAADKSEMILIGKSGNDNGNLFAFNLLSALITKPEVALEFEEVVSQEALFSANLEMDTDGKPILVKFMMGQNENGKDYNPQHEAKIKRPYKIQKTEVTQSQWFEVMGANPSFHKGTKFCTDYDPKKDICPNLPVESVTWDEVEVFIQKLNQTQQNILQRDGTMYALPTEAEWEYAARGGDKAKSQGPTFFDAKANLLNFAWTQENSTGPSLTELIPKNVAMLAPSPLGLYDIYGNVWEWTSDIYNAAGYNNANADPNSPERALRGGSFFLGGEFSNSVVRRGLKKKSSDRRTGFRLVRVPADQSQQNMNMNPNNNQYNDQPSVDFIEGVPPV